MIEPLDLPRRFRFTEFGPKDRREAPRHPPGWYMMARAKTTAAFALVDTNEQVIAQFSKLPIRSFESGAPIPELRKMMSKLGQAIVYADLEDCRRPMIDYVGWLGTKGRGPSHISFPIHDGTTTMSTTARVRFGDITDPASLSDLHGELTVYRALDGQPTTDETFTVNIECKRAGERIDIQLPIAAAVGFARLVAELVAAGQRDGLLPKED